jgi:hypothetical protein
MKVNDKKIPTNISKFLDYLKVKKKDSEINIAVKQAMTELFEPMLAGSSKPISALPVASTPLTGDELVPVVQAGVTDKTTVNNINKVAFSTMGFVTVGNGAQYDYQTMHDAIVDGNSHLFVVTDITETISTVFSSNVNIICNPVNITFSNDITFDADAGSFLFNMTALYGGVVNISYNFTSDNVLFDLSQISNAPPGSINGTFIFANGSDPSVSAKPMVCQSATPYAFHIDTIIYVNNGGLNSYFELGVGFVDNFIMVCNSANDCAGIYILNNGTINNAILASDCSTDTVLFNVFNTTINNITVLDATAAPFCYLSNSIVNSAAALGSSALKLNISGLNSGELSIVNNARNVVILPSGDYGSIINNSLIAGINTSGATGGTIKFNSCSFAGVFNLSNTDAYFNFTTTTFKQGFEITDSPGTQLNFCDYGAPGGAFGLTLNAGALNTTVVGGRTNTATVDNGTNTQIIPIPQLF